MVRSASSTSVSAARWLVGVIAGVALCFLFATGFAQHREDAIAGRANLIIGNAMPSVQMLAKARGQVRALERETERYAAAPAGERAALRDQISATREDLDAALASYRALPFFREERELFDHVEDSLVGPDRALANLHGAVDLATLVSLHRDLDLVDQAIERVVSFDAEQGQRLGLEIERIRGEARGAEALLDASSIALAVLATLLALRQLGHTARAHEAERQASERRGTELAARVEALGQFAGRVAHDILSPLATTSLSLELVRKAVEHDASARRATERGHAALDRVQTLVDGLLTFSHAGGRPEPGVTTELAPVIADVVDALAEQAKREGIVLSVRPIPEGSAACNPGVLTSLISNLVRNAIRHMGEAPERRIEVRTIRVADRWRIEVEDTGPGVPLEQQQRIFEPYVQLAPRAASGIGLGLATVERLVRAHGGTVGLISPVARARGSLFWFELPIGPSIPGDTLTRARAP